jgi:hypothetical protein
MYFYIRYIQRGLQTYEKTQIPLNVLKHSPHR